MRKPRKPLSRSTLVNIRSRILFGFGALISALVIMAAVGITALAKVNDAFAEYRGASTVSKEIGTWNLTLGTARLAVEEYFGAPSPKTAAAAQGALSDLMESSRNTAEKMNRDGEAQTLISAVTTTIENAVAALEKTIAAQKAVDVHVTRAKEFADVVQKALVGISDQAFSNQDYEGTYYSAITLQQFSSSINNLTTFVSDGAFEAFDLANINAKNARSTFRNSMSLRFEEIYAQRRDIYQDGLKSYQETIELIGEGNETLLFNRDELRALIGEGVETQAGLVTDFVISQQNNMERLGNQRSDDARFLLIQIAAMTLIVGTILAIITVKSISRTINTFSGVLLDIANDKLNIDIETSGASHALAQMSRALEKLRENALAAREVEEQKRALLKRQAEESEQARLKTEQDHARQLEAETQEKRRQEEAAAELKRVEDAASAERQTRLAEQTDVVTALAEGLKRLSAGDIRQKIVKPFPSDQDELREDYNFAIESLRELLIKISGVSGELFANVSEISGVASSLSKFAEQNAHAISVSASELEDISGTVDATADRALEAEKLIRETSETAKSSNEIVSDAIRTMGAISSSSKQVAKIVDVIEDIAFQTNLLSLNASVEASRAGEAGRGFAVVATEVRALSQRSAEAASEINALISAAVNEVENGVSFVNQTGDALHTVSKKIGEFENVMVEISAAAGRQANGLKNIHTSIGKLETTTQSNAAVSEEVTAASEILKQQAVTLTDLVAEFIIEDAPQASSAA